jgi:hypothetical protein
MRDWFLKQLPLFWRIGKYAGTLVIGGVVTIFVKGWDYKTKTDSYIDYRAGLVFDAKAGPMVAQREEQIIAIHERLGNIERGQQDISKVVYEMRGSMNSFIETARAPALHNRTR